MKFVFLLCAALWLAFPAAATQRFALVIGINDYAELRDLQKARNDATAIAEALEKLGYAAALLLDPDRRSISRGLSEMVAKAGPGDEVLFYFAGHGIQIDGRNYLIPADAPAAGPGDEAYLTAESVAVDRVLETLQSRGVRTAVLILDACRDNPFPRSGTRSVGGVRGLAATAATEGSFILYSAGTGQTALDRLSDEDADPNSVFTRHLLPFLNEPDRPLQEMARSLRADVEAQAASVNHHQRPAYYDELTGDYLLAAASPPPPVAVPEPLPAAEEDPCSSARRDWEGIAALNDPAMLRAFAVAHFSCQDLRDAALERVAQLERGVQAPPPAAAPEAPSAAAEAPPAEVPPAAIEAPPAVAEAPALPEPAVLPPTPDLAIAVQTELKRLGCYRGGIDGKWGPGSRKALAQFYKTADEADLAARLGPDPSEAVLARLVLPDNANCPRPAAPVAARTVAKPQTAKTEPAAPAPAAEPAKKKKCGKLFLFPIPVPISVC